LEVNAGIPLADEPAILAETVQLVQSLTDVPLSIDSSIVAALEAGLAIDEAKDDELREWIDRQKASFPDSNV
jgi:5-methyltetrahydrofolate--homocysteine methyltransferase